MDAAQQRILIVDDEENVVALFKRVLTKKGYAVQGASTAEEALETLVPFFERTNSPTLIRHLEVDPDLDSIRKDRRFIEMVAAAKKRLGITDAAE